MMYFLVCIDNGKVSYWSGDARLCDNLINAKLYLRAVDASQDSWLQSGYLNSDLQVHTKESLDHKLASDIYRAGVTAENNRLSLLELRLSE